MTAMEEISIQASDGFALAGSLFPSASSPRAVVLVGPACGVGQRLYRPYAEFLAEQGLTAITWDWRGIGGSRPARLRGFAASMSDWGRRDFPGVIDWASAHYPSLPLLVVGHSFTGQSLGMASNAGKVQAMISIAAPNGYWRNYERRRRYHYALLWYLVIPAISHLFGYFPARRLRLGEDLPLGVALEWCRWNRTPEFMGDFRGHRAFRAPILAFSFDDDPQAPRAAVDALHASYGSENLVRRHVVPREIGARRVAHMGFFKPGAVPGLWEETAAWLLARAEAACGEGEQPDPARQAVPIGLPGN